MAANRWADERAGLVERLREAGYVRSERVARAIDAVPRERFVPENARESAYEDVPLDIGEGQVVTAPHLVATMTELLEPAAGHRILEIGAGSGYHAAVTAEIAGAGNVYSVERIPELVERARRHLAVAGYGDGSGGLPERAPFDRISVACAAPDVPDPLVEQLVDGGRMVIPIGRTSQTLVLVEKRGGRIERTPYGAVRFVPLVGEHGFEE